VLSAPFSFTTDPRPVAPIAVEIALCDKHRHVSVPVDDQYGCRAYGVATAAVALWHASAVAASVVRLPNKSPAAAAASNCLIINQKPNLYFMPWTGHSLTVAQELKGCLFKVKAAKNFACVYMYICMLVIGCLQLMLTAAN
jgi:hypothetical protein